MSSIKKQRLSVLREIDSLSDTHCKPCDVKSVNEGCQECEIGIRIRKLGNRLGKVKVPKIEKKVPKRKSQKPKGGRKVEFTKEAYQAVKNEGKTDKEIKAIFGIDNNKLYKMKREWGLTGQNKPTWSKSEEEYKSLIGQLKDELSGRDDLIGKLEATIKKYQDRPANDEQVKELNEKVAHLESACLDVEDELDQYKTKLRIAASALDQANEKVEMLEDEKKIAIDEIMELRSKNATAERELKIAEENLTAANKSLRNKDAALEQLERELSYARENERTLKSTEDIFKAALKAAL